MQADPPAKLSAPPAVVDLPIAKEELFEEVVFSPKATEPLLLACVMGLVPPLFHPIANEPIPLDKTLRLCSSLAP